MSGHFMEEVNIKCSLPQADVCELIPTKPGKLSKKISPYASESGIYKKLPRQRRSENSLVHLAIDDWPVFHFL